MARNNAGFLERRGQQGNVAPTVAILLVVLIGAVAFALDLGNIYRVRNELQTSSDAAALAGALMLDGTSAGIAAARAAAIEYADKNRADGDSVELLPEDIEFGHWDTANSQWTSYGTSPSSDLGQVNGVKILSQRSQERNDPVKHFFAPILGKNKSDVRADAIAVGGGPYTEECTSPMVVGECTFGANHDNVCDACIQFQNNNDDTGGWTTFGTLDNPTPLGQGKIAELLVQQCYPSEIWNDYKDYSDYVPVLDEEGVCSGECRETVAGESYDVKNGVGMDDGEDHYCRVIQDILCRGVDDGIKKAPQCSSPRAFKLISPVIEGCEFKSGQTIAGFATVTIWGAKCGNSSIALQDPNAPLSCPAPPSDKYITATITCDLEPIGYAGGGFFGMDAQIRLVE